MNGNNKHEGMVRGFIHYNEAWYKQPDGLVDDGLDEVTFGYFCPSEGGTTGEMHVSWYEIGGKPVPKLEAFDDAWSALATFSDVIATMGKYDDQNITPEAFCALLTSLGFQDMTARESPSIPPQFPSMGDKVLWRGMNATVGVMSGRWINYQPCHNITLVSGGGSFIVQDSELIKPE